MAKNGAEAAMMEVWRSYKAEGAGAVLSFSQFRKIWRKSGLK